MKILWRIRLDNTIKRAVPLFEGDRGSYTYDEYYAHTVDMDKFVVINILDEFYVVNNNKMYSCDGEFNDQLYLAKYEKFSTEEEALMYATSCV